MAGLELLHFINGVIQYFKIIFTKYIIISELLLLTKGLNEILLGNLLVRVRKWLDTDCTVSPQRLHKIITNNYLPETVRRTACLSLGSVLIWHSYSPWSVIWAALSCRVQAAESPSGCSMLNLWSAVNVNPADAKMCKSRRLIHDTYGCTSVTWVRTIILWKNKPN